jgi:hypothetical protein
VKSPEEIADAVLKGCEMVRTYRTARANELRRVVSEIVEAHQPPLVLSGERIRRILEHSRSEFAKTSVRTLQRHAAAARDETARQSGSVSHASETPDAVSFVREDREP